ncbi:tRNA (adenosine(37)-N6)-dimethylallyltransferase MiaA [Wenxinia saemankumensis]|uniref:tRNA dimethylallyltransferase n=1 Tax=Wenxinia saemankumensis TaxID=1447782 RepID=A0A1M6A063_9RHOB|nr:tRNA (adenosine(37)-N6)-dimethylallyltransferase MiaA [Wenxinia saemankumensis]SHI29902.1 tRNA dimethylallyltransferase [Wenxinia saemankumensis]
MSESRAGINVAGERVTGETLDAEKLRARIAGLPPDRPVLIAGPTASGKSALALRIAEEAGGVVVNADALQVYAGWEVLTAQPPAEDRARAPHLLYGHLAPEADWSVGHWLRAVEPLLAGGARPIVTGGTGLYFTALTEGLAEVPPVPPAIRAQGDSLSLEALRDGLAPADAARIDIANRARVQRAWEVRRATGRALAEWQAAPAAPLLPPGSAERLLIDAPKDWLTPRIERRFDAMLAGGALDEARAMHPRWDPALPSSRAIGAAELIAHLEGRMGLDEVRVRAAIQTRQYAKRQRTWFRARMGDWSAVPALSTG